MRKLKAKKISDYTDKLHLFEATSRYVADEAVRTNKSRAVVIRELAEEARIARVSGKQMSIGLLKPVRAAQKEIVEETLSETVAAPLDSLFAELEKVNLSLYEANKKLTDAATEAENQRRNLRRIFYIVSLLWNLLYNFARFDSPDKNNEASKMSTGERQQLIDSWAMFDSGSAAQTTLAHEVNRRMTEQQQRQRQNIIEPQLQPQD